MLALIVFSGNIKFNLINSNMCLMLFKLAFKFVLLLFVLDVTKVLVNLPGRIDRMISDLK